MPHSCYTVEVVTMCVQLLCVMAWHGVISTSAQMLVAPTVALCKYSLGCLSVPALPSTLVGYDYGSKFEPKSKERERDHRAGH
jgi:hypothetical protein